MGAGPSAPAVVNVGLPGDSDISTPQWPRDEGSEGKTHIGSDHGGFWGLSSVSKMIQPGSTRLILGANNGLGGSKSHPDGPDGWVDATVSTPLFPHGRPAGVERQQARHQKRVSKFRVFSDGVVFEGPEAMAIGDTHDLCKGYERLMGRPITRVTVGDKRAQQVLVAWADGKFWAVPSRQSFSRHLGVCLILGDKSAKGPRHTLRVGDILRLGSVGLLVSEVCSGGDTESQVVSQDVLDQIREDIHTAPKQVLAPLRKDFHPTTSSQECDHPHTDGEDEDHLHEGSGLKGEVEEEDIEGEETGPESDAGIGPSGDNGNNSYQCYICMDSSEEEEEGDVLIAPCLCKGSTALVHVKCLQRLLSTGDAQKTNVISTKHQNHTCRICKARYKTHVKLSDGTLVPLLNPSLVPPYITLVVITRHESHPDLFNTIFQLSFARSSELSLGRSQGCDVVIGYRTVSTRHATISYSRGEFHYQDARSSNGSLLYLRGPLEVPANRPVRLRMGRSILSLKARGSLQLTSLPRKTAGEAWRWLTSLGGRRGRGVGREVGYDGPYRQPGLDLLKDLHMGRLDGEGGMMLHGGEEDLLDDGQGRFERLAWHLDSSSSSLVDDEGPAGRGGEGGDELGGTTETVGTEEERGPTAVDGWRRAVRVIDGGEEAKRGVEEEEVVAPRRRGGRDSRGRGGRGSASVAAGGSGGLVAEGGGRTVPASSIEGAEEAGGGGVDDLLHPEDPPSFRPAAHSESTVLGPSRRVVLERTRSSRV